MNANQDRLWESPMPVEPEDASDDELWRGFGPRYFSTIEESSTPHLETDSGDGNESGWKVESSPATTSGETSEFGTLDSVSRYLKEMGTVPLLTRARERFLFRSLSRTRARQARLLGRLRFSTTHVLQRNWMRMNERDPFDAIERPQHDRSHTFESQQAAFGKKASAIVAEMELVAGRLRQRPGSRANRLALRDYRRCLVRLGRVWVQLAPSENLR